jgi:hypothetical protein
MPADTVKAEVRGARLFRVCCSDHPDRGGDRGLGPGRHVARSDRAEAQPQPAVRPFADDIFVEALDGRGVGLDLSDHRQEVMVTAPS